jgi:hypothetical protein
MFVVILSVFTQLSLSLHSFISNLMPHLCYLHIYIQWYTASEEGGSIWTEPYPFVGDGSLGITAALQLTNTEGKFLGVMGADYRLSNIENILVAKVANTPNLVYITDNKGLMMSASIVGASLDDNNQQVRANESSIDLIRLSAIALDDTFHKNWTWANGVLLTIDVPGEGVYFAQSNELIEEVVIIF